MKSKQYGGAKKLIATKNLFKLTEFKKINNRFEDFNYDDYNKIITLTDPILLIQNINTYTKKHKNLANILNNFYNIINIDNLYTGTLETSITINNIYNKKMLLLIPSINIIRVINKISNSNKFDVVLDKGILSSKYDSEVNKMDVVNNVHGSYSKTAKETYPELTKELNEKYDNVVLISSSVIHLTYPSIYNFCQLPEMLAKIILGMSALKKDGNLFCHMKVGLEYPLLKQILDLLVYCFESVEYENLKYRKASFMLHCNKLNKNKYNKLKPELDSLLDILDNYIIDQNNYKNIISQSETNGKMFYPVDKPDISTDKYDILYKINIDIPSSKTGAQITKLIEGVFIDELNNINYKMSIYLPLNEQKILNILNKTAYVYTANVVNFLEQHHIPYNKYYLSLIDDYYEDIITNIYSLTNNINIHLIAYSNASKIKSRSITKHTRQTRNKHSKSIKSPKDYLHHIDGKSNPYTYSGFNSSIKQLEYVKQTRRQLMNTYDANGMKKIIRVVEDFTRGISLYLYKRFKTDIIPSNAFTKLWEIYHYFDLVPNKKHIRMFHLAEAPGQFIKATEHYIKKNCPKNEKYLWKANSLNPFNKEVTKKYGKALFRDDYNLIKKNKQNWIWGEDTTGDITRSQNVRWYRQYLKKWANDGPIDIVTGDGGLELDCQMIELQKLDYGQFLLAAATSSMGKHCAIKTFTPFMGNRPETFNAGGFFVGLLFLYNLLYRDVYLFKPYTSRPTSGEYYIIGKRFIGLPDFALEKLLTILDNFKINQPFFKEGVIPDSFVKQTYKFIEQMSSLNSQTIERQNFFLSCVNDDDDVVSKKTNCKFYLNPDNLSKIHEARYRKWVKLFDFK
jgi:hypothetical protein